MLLGDDDICKNKKWSMIIQGKSYTLENPETTFIINRNLRDTFSSRGRRKEKDKEEQKPI